VHRSAEGEIDGQLLTITTDSPVTKEFPMQDTSTSQLEIVSASEELPQVIERSRKSRLNWAKRHPQQLQARPILA